jgi:predicted phosphoribosyltransferase
MTCAEGAIYADRAEAGQVLARLLYRYRATPNALVLALPRGGVPVGFEIAQHLNLPLDVWIVRKLGVPGQEELAMGAIASGELVVLNRSVIRALHISAEEIQQVIERERIEMARRERQFRGDRPAPEVRDRVVILVDDGLATGSTMRAAAQAIRARSPERIIVAVPLGPEEACAELQADADQVICAKTPAHFSAVGACYRSFPQTTDEEVRELLALSHDRLKAARNLA